MSVLPTPPSGRRQAVRWVRTHLGHLAAEPAEEIRAGGFCGGQSAADAALAALDLTGYAGRRSAVLPRSARGATRLSPYIRHGLLPLPDVWIAAPEAAGGHGRDLARFRDELLWQEYARHLYFRTAEAMSRELRHPPPQPRDPWDRPPWPREMACVKEMLTELHQDGWLVNQARLWLASQWTVRAGADWRAGEDAMFTHLVDGSRAANRLGWQWAGGTATGRPYGFSRQQVTRQAPHLCHRCVLREQCPIEQWHPPQSEEPLSQALHTSCQPVPSPAGVAGAGGQVVWLTAESLGSGDPALAADASRPAVFVFDEPLLARLRLSGKRLVFLAETLADLATRRPVQVRLGAPTAELAGLRLAATWTPVPGWHRRAQRLRIVELHPWRWLVRPDGLPVQSHSTWRRQAERHGRIPA